MRLVLSVPPVNVSMNTCSRINTLLETQHQCGSCLLHVNWPQVRTLIQAAYDRARNILTSHQEELHQLAKHLLETETVSGDDIRGLLGLPMLPKTETIMKGLVSKGAEAALSGAKAGAVAAAGGAAVAAGAKQRPGQAGRIGGA